MSAQKILLARYGEPDAAYLKEYCLVWYVKGDFPWFPAKSFLVNVDFKRKLEIAFKNLEEAGIHTEIKTFDGCYNDRSVRDHPEAESLHGWAAAIDINAALNPMINNPKPEQRQGNWTPLFIQIMKAAGIYFGGDFRLRADSMHWALENG